MTVAYVVVVALEGLRLLTFSLYRFSSRAGSSLATGSGPRGRRAGPLRHDRLQSAVEARSIETASDRRQVIDSRYASSWFSKMCRRAAKRSGPDAP